MIDGFKNNFFLIFGLKGIIEIYVGCFPVYLLEGWGGGGGGGYKKDVKSMCMCVGAKIALLSHCIWGRGVYVKRGSWVAE